MIKKGSRINGVPFLREDSNYIQLERLELMNPSGKESKKEYDESTVQEIIEKCPKILPFSEIDNSLGEFAHLVREYPTSNGLVDNLLIGDSGEICIIETKLWVNPEARRKVIGQIMDYSSCLKGMSYNDFENNIKVIFKKNNNDYDSLYSFYHKHFPDGYSEKYFIDQISTNLKKGEFILIIVGDGIRSEIESIADFMDQNPNNLSRLSLVEIRIYKTEKGYLFLPLLVTKTTEICRTVVELKSDKIDAQVLLKDNKQSTGSVKVTTYEQQSIESILSKVEAEKGSVAKENLNYLFEYSQKNGFLIKPGKQGHSINKWIETIEGQKKFTFFEIWDHVWGGKEYHLYDIQILISANFPEQVLSEYQHKIAMITDKAWPKRKQKAEWVSWVTIDLSKNDCKEMLTRLVDLATEIVVEIEAYYDQSK